MSDMVEPTIIRRLKASSANRQRLVQFLTAIDHIFPVPLSKKVVITEYVDKVFSCGIVICAEVCGKPVGAVLGYANDTVTKRGFISTLGVIPGHQSKGIGHDLLDSMKDVSHRKGMTSIGLFVRKTNSTAVNFYNQNQFEMISGCQPERDDSIYLVCQLNTMSN